MNDLLILRKLWSVGGNCCQATVVQVMGHQGIYPRLAKMQTWFSVTSQIEAQRQARDSFH